MQTLIADTIEVLRIGFWATFWSLSGSCLIALLVSWVERLLPRAWTVGRSTYTGPRALRGTVLMLLAIAVLASSWLFWAVMGAGPGDSLGEQISKAVAGSEPGHIALLVVSVVSLLTFSVGAISYLYSERVEQSQSPIASAPPTSAQAA